jgi:toxin-antitoxin system PIN domain toxin
VIVVDLNLLLYAVNSDADRHEAARTWWEDVLGGNVPVGLPWVVILGFVRIATNPRVFPRPLTVEAAIGIVDGWLDQPVVRCLEPSERHWPILRRLLVTLGAAGNLTIDAHLAALALESGATLCSTDNDFSRFPDLRWENPLD